MNYKKVPLNQLIKILCNGCDERLCNVILGPECEFWPCPDCELKIEQWSLKNVKKEKTKN